MEDVCGLNLEGLAVEVTVALKLEAAHRVNLVSVRTNAHTL